MAGRTARNGYAGKHPSVRAEWAARLKAAGSLPCMDPAPGCPGQIIHGERWDLAHVHGDRSRYLGPAHPRCNRWWAALKSNRSPLRRMRKRPRPVAPSVFGPLSR